MTTSHHPETPTTDTPKHEGRDANLRIIVFVGCILIAGAVVAHVAVWGLFHYFKERDNALKARPNLPLAQAEMNQLPASPRLEAFEPLHAGIYLREDNGRDWVFYVDSAITVVRVPREGKATGLYDLHPGDAVSVTYLPPRGLSGGDGVTPEEQQPTRFRAVRVEIGPGRSPAGTSSETGLVTVRGTLTRVNPTKGSDMREAAEARLGRYGWVDRKKQIAHIPIDRAVQILLDRGLLRSGPAGGEEKKR
jgi:hypothetical protein